MSGEILDDWECSWGLDLKWNIFLCHVKFSLIFFDFSSLEKQQILDILWFSLFIFQMIGHMTTTWMFTWYMHGITWCTCGGHMTTMSPDLFSYPFFYLIRSIAQPCTALHSLAGVLPMTNTASHGSCAQPCTATDESCMSHGVSHNVGQDVSYIGRLSFSCIALQYFIFCLPFISKITKLGMFGYICTYLL